MKIKVVTLTEHELKKLLVRAYNQGIKAYQRTADDPGSVKEFERLKRTIFNTQQRLTAIETIIAEGGVVNDL